MLQSVIGSEMAEMAEMADDKPDVAQGREMQIYRWVAATWMLAAIVFGVLNLTGIINVR